MVPGDITPTIKKYDIETKCNNILSRTWIRSPLQKHTNCVLWFCLSVILADSWQIIWQFYWQPWAGSLLYFLRKSKLSAGWQIDPTQSAGNCHHSGWWHYHDEIVNCQTSASWKWVVNGQLKTGWRYVYFC